MDEIQLAQPYESMFERNIGHLAKRGREVAVWVEGVPDPRIGFIGGLDEEFLQICITQNATLSSVRRDMLASVDETGVSIGSLITGSKGTDDAVRVDRIREKISPFQKRAARAMAVSV